MSEPQVLTANEARVVALLRELKANKGHGQLLIEVRDGLESLFKPTPYELPPDRREPRR